MRVFLGFQLAGVALLLFLVMMIAGCAMMQLPDNATPEQKRAALCQDAQAGLAMADATLADPKILPEARLYWTAFRAGAMAGINAYCVE